MLAQAGTIAAARILRLDRNGSAEPGYEYTLCCQPAAMDPNVVLQSSGYTMIVGDFSSVSNQPRGHAARLFEENVFASGFQ